MSKNLHQAIVVNTSHSHFARLVPVSLGAVRLTDQFWQPRLEVNRLVTLPSQFQQLEETGRLDHFRRAAREIHGPFLGRVYDDSDVYKWLEAACWTIATDPEPGLTGQIDEVVQLIEKAQDPDGYVNTYFVGEYADKRWSNLKDWHELYCAGHLIQAAIAHQRATGGDRLLSVARRFADHIVTRLGPRSGQQPGTGGHPQIEMALVELFRATDHAPYLDQATYFLDVRGRGLIGGQAYHQDRAPFTALERLEGHAVRAVYLAAGASDLLAETGRPELRETLERLWLHLTSKQMYISGGIGARAAGEAFGEDYELPDRLAYAESCAAIGNLMWAWRMLLLYGQARYADLVERILYNGALVGISEDGLGYFYWNPLADAGNTRRLPWYSTACCPPNLARLLSILPGILFGISREGLWVHIYAASEMEAALTDGQRIRLLVSTEYPWSGDVDIEVRTDGRFGLFLRVPAWCRPGNARVEFNGEAIERVPRPGSYVYLDRAWKSGDRIKLIFLMPVERIRAHPAIEDYRGRVALMRGPVLYCLEQADHPSLPSESIYLPHDSALDAAYDGQLLGGVVTIRGQGRRTLPDEAWNGLLYRPEAAPPQAAGTEPVELTAVPYFSWANRQPGWMRVWIPVLL